MRISRERLSSILQFYLQDMTLEDNIMNAILDEEVEEKTAQGYCVECDDYCYN